MINLLTETKEINKLPEFIKTLIFNSIDTLFTGSKYICPAVVSKDIDIMLLVGDITKFIDKYNLEMNGEQVQYRDDLMVSCRYGIYNILLTADKPYFKKWHFATHIAKELDLTDKQDRKRLFQLICDNDTIKIND